MNRENLLKYPLSGEEMIRLNPGARLITYDKLNNIVDIEQVFKNSDKVIILYLLQSRNAGHWVSVFKNEQGYNFFDSYGHVPDYEVDNLTVSQRQDFNEKRDILTKLFYNNNVYYNNHKFQQKGTMTCGCFVSHRLNNYLLTDDEYCDELEKIKNPDLFVAEYCLRKLNNIGY